jgi:electron transport complex protein RnfB
MATDVYERLARHLDNLPPGYPSTDSGVELRILRRLFTPEEAELAQHLTLIPEAARVVARRAKLPVEEAAQRLEDMLEKRLIHASVREGYPNRYQASAFVVGFWEGQVDRLDLELVQDFEEYLPTALDPDLWQKAPQLRTVPVGESISAQTEVMLHEQAEELVRSHDTFAVANCICRQEMHILGEGCDKPLQSCLALGRAAESTVRVGRARVISQEEAVMLLRQAEETGLVLQPSNTQTAAFI